MMTPRRRCAAALAVAALAALATLSTGCSDDDGGGVSPPVAIPIPEGPALSGAGNPTLLGLTDDQRLLQFRANTPGASLGSLQLTGNMIDNPAQPPVVQGMDFSPANGRLYVYFSDGRFYTVGNTGALTLVGTAPTAFPSPGFIDSIDFNPVPNLIRAMSDQSERGNYRVNPADATLAFTDTAAAYGAGDANASNTPSIEGLAYTGGAGVTSTTAYVIDATQDVLATLGSPGGMPESPNGGRLFTVGALGTAIGGGGSIGFDIPTAPNTTTGFVSDGATGASSADSSIFSINLSTGALTLLGTVTGSRLAGIAVAPGTGMSMTGMPPPAPGVIGLPTGNEFCKTALAGTGFTATPVAASTTCLMCAFSPSTAETLVDTDLENVTTFTGTGIVGTQSLTVAAADPTKDIMPVADTFVGGLFRLPPGDPGQLAVAPSITITTFDDDTATADTVTFSTLPPTLNGPLLYADAMGTGLPISDITGEPFFAGFNATVKFDAIQVTFSPGVIGLNTTMDLFYVCTEAAAEGGFPLGVGP